MPKLSKKYYERTFVELVKIPKDFIEKHKLRELVHKCVAWSEVQDGIHGLAHADAVVCKDLTT